MLADKLSLQFFHNLVIFKLRALLSSRKCIPNTFAFLFNQVATCYNTFGQERIVGDELVLFVGKHVSNVREEQEVALVEINITQNKDPNLI